MTDAQPMAESAEARLASLELLFHAAPVGLCLIGLDFRYVTVNEYFADLYELPISSFVGRTVAQVLPNVAEQIMANLRASLATGTMVETELKIERTLPDGTTRHLTYLRSAQPLRDAAGVTSGFSVALIDITERKLVEAALRESEADYRYTVDLNPHIPWTTDAQGNTTYSSSRFLDFTGLTQQQAQEQGWGPSIHPDDRDRAWRCRIASLASGEPFDSTHRLRAASGEWRWVRVRGFPRRDAQGNVVKWYGTVEDIHESTLIDEALRQKTTRLEEATAELARLACQDHLTGLANRRHFDESFEREFARAQRSGHPLGMVLIDVDHFKRFNDGYGHLAGDDALRAVARMLKEVLRRPSDLAARYGGEEFVLLLPETGEEGTFEVAREACACVRTLGIPHHDSARGCLTISAGFAIFNPRLGWAVDGDGADLIQAADAALYAAKSSGRDCVLSARFVAEESESFNASQEVA